MVAIVRHDQTCHAQGMGHSDAAKRVSDTYRLHKAADTYGAVGKWIAVALADGTTDNTLYDTKTEAVRHQHHNERWYAYINLSPGDMSVCDAEGYLKTWRMLYDKGIMMVDPNNAKQPEPITRLNREDQRSQMRSIANGGRTRPSNLIIGSN